VDAPDGCTAGDLLPLLASRFPGLDALFPTLQVAVNQRYAQRAAPLAPGDEVALIPPISGG
jgi:molybdopterin converting factor small subunit